MPWPYLGERSSEQCPCCGKDVDMPLCAIITVHQVWEALYPYRRGDAPPPPVLCVNERGKPVRQGVAVTWRHHTGVIDVGVLPRPGDWDHGWWWPLDRVLWEVKEG